MNVLGNIVTLRAIEEEDLSLLKDMINDPEIEKMVGGYSFPTSQTQQKLWFNATSTDPNNLRLIIETDSGSVGLVNIINIDWKNRSAFHGIKIASNNNRCKGIGTDAVMTIMKYVFEELQLNRLESSIIEYNEPSRKLYCEKCGWKIEGIKRKSVFKGNKYNDELIISILKEDYEKLIADNNYWSR